MEIPQGLLDSVAIDPASPSGLVWVISPNRRIQVGTACGCIVGTETYKHWSVGWKGRNYRAHRVIMVKLHGQSELEVDHINRNPLDNSLSNLRWATRKQNLFNRVFQEKANGLPTGIHAHRKGYRFKTGRKMSRTYYTIKEAYDARLRYLHDGQLPVVPKGETATGHDGG